MKVLILHQYFNTPARGGAIRSYYLAKALVDRGISTVVITAHNESSYRQENVEGIDVHYLPVAYDNKFGFSARIISFLKFYWKSVRLASRLNDFTICYAISVPLTVGWAAIRIKKTLKVPFLFEVGDLWPDAPIQMGFVQNFFLRKILYSAELSIYRQADSIVALSPAIRTAIEKKIPGKTVHLIPNMADVDYYKAETKVPELIAKWGLRDKFVISYIGAVGVANGLDYFLECANAARKANLPIQFLLAGDGALLQRLRTASERLGLQNLTFLGFLDRESVRQVMTITDAVFVCYKRVPILETGSPNKFFDGLAAAKMIIINFGGWVREEIDHERCGIYVDPQQPEDFTGKISPFLKDTILLKKYQDAARALGTRKYSRAFLTGQFANLFNEKQA